MPKGKPTLADESEDPRGPLWVRPDENSAQHRALLLWAMQINERSSLRLVGRAIGKPESTIRRWRHLLGWDDRIKQAGLGGEALALRLYRQLYYVSKGQRELAVVEPYISGRVFADEPPMPAGTTIGAQQEAAQQAERGDNGAHATRKTRERHLAIIDASLARYAQALTSGDVKVRPADVFSLLRARQLITGEVGYAGLAALPAEESTRVRLARAGNGDVLAALREDLGELVVVVEAMMVSRAQGEEHQARANEARLRDDAAKEQNAENVREEVEHEGTEP